MTIKDMGLGDSLDDVVEMFRVMHQHVEVKSKEFLSACSGAIGQRQHHTSNF